MIFIDILEAWRYFVEVREIKRRKDYSRMRKNNLRIKLECRIVQVDVFSFKVILKLVLHKSSSCKIVFVEVF